MLEALNSNSAGLADSNGKWQAKSRLMPCKDRPRPPAGRGRAPGATTGQIRTRAPPPRRAGLLAKNLVVDALLGRRAKPSSIIHHALPLEAVSRRRVGLLPVSAATIPVPAKLHLPRAARQRRRKMSKKGVCFLTRLLTFARWPRGSRPIWARRRRCADSS